MSLSIQTKSMCVSVVLVFGRMMHMYSVQSTVYTTFSRAIASFVKHCDYELHDENCFSCDQDDDDYDDDDVDVDNNKRHTTSYMRGNDVFGALFCVLWFVFFFLFLIFMNAFIFPQNFFFSFICLFHYQQQHIEEVFWMRVHTSKFICGFSTFALRLTHSFMRMKFYDTMLDEHRIFEWKEKSTEIVMKLKLKTTHETWNERMNDEYKGYWLCIKCA